MNDLEILGWGHDLQRAFEALAADLDDMNLLPGRVVAAHGDRHDLLTAAGPLAALPSGRLRRDLAPDERPVTGDWVAFHRGSGAEGHVLAVLPRRTRLARQAPGRPTRTQVLAANVDVVFVVTACGHDRNPRRVERYAVMVYESGATPVIVLNKTDLDPAWPMEKTRLADVAAGAPVVAVSALDAGAEDALAPWLQPGRTVALVGPSGVGKSTLLNRLAGRSLQATGPVRDHDARGRHTTTRRELVLLPTDPPGERGLLIDTPGIRELQPVADGDDIGDVFPDVRALADRCRFRDCTHAHEPGCAVRAAVEAGTLDAGRLDAWQRLVHEAASAARRRDAAARQDERRQGRAFNQLVRDVNRLNPKRR